MKLQKTNGKYMKPGLRWNTNLPALVWIVPLSGIFTLTTALALRTAQLQSGPQPELSVIRKHSYKVIAVGDIACAPNESNFNEGNGIVGACQQKAVGRAVENEKADAVLLLGDIQYTTGLLADFNLSFVPYWREVKSPIYVAAGNHDYGNGVREANLKDYGLAFDTYFPQATYQKAGKTYYDFNLGPWQFYVLDSNCTYVGGCDVDSPQLNWLTGKANNTSNLCSVAMWHHPLFTSGPHRLDTDIADRKQFWDVLQSANTDIVLNGHDHNYERFAPQSSEGQPDTKGIREFVSGAGGYSLRKMLQPIQNNSEKQIDDSFGYLVLDLSPGYYSWEFKNIDGMVLDNGTDVCH